MLNAHAKDTRGKTHEATGEPKARRLRTLPFTVGDRVTSRHKCCRARRAPPRRCYAALTVTYYYLVKSK